MNKRCASCGEIKSSDEFHVRKASKDGLASSCAECINERNRKKYAADEDHRAVKILQAGENRRRRQEAA